MMMIQTMISFLLSQVRAGHHAMHASIGSTRDATCLCQAMLLCVFVSNLIFNEHFAFGHDKECHPSCPFILLNVFGAVYCATKK